MRLDGRQMEALVKALGSAFTVDTLTMLLRFRLDKDLEDYAAPAVKQMRIFELVDASQKEGWTVELLAAAREANPGNPELSLLGGEIGLASIGLDRSRLERIVRDQTPFNDLRPWLERWGRIECQVCRVEVYEQGAVGYGTGFLVGPDLVLTNHHVVAGVIAGAVAADRVLCRFGYKRLADGMALDQGREFRLAAAPDWLVDTSPPSPEDEKVDGGLPDPEQLDYALLRLADKAGELPVGAKPEPGAKRRGWITIAEPVPVLAAEDIVFMLEHPNHEPLKQASGQILAVNANGTRVRHDANTDGGSSGSPCFAANLELVALHHAGDPNYEKLHHPTYNQAIPMDKIVARLESRHVRIGVPA